jgi:hypothetical protein
VTTAPVRSRSPSSGWKPGTSPGRRRLALGQHLPTGVLHGRQQVDLTAITAGAPQRLAVHRDRPSTSMLVRTLAVGQPRTDRPGQGLSIQAARVRRMVASAGTAQRSGASRRAPSATRTGWAGSSGPLGDRDHRPGAGQHRRGGHGQDGNQRVAAPGALPWVNDGGQVGEQVRGSAGRSGSTSQSGASPDGIGDDGSAGTGFHRGS